MDDVRAALFCCGHLPKHKTTVSLHICVHGKLASRDFKFSSAWFPGTPFSLWCYCTLNSAHAFNLGEAFFLCVNQRMPRFRVALLQMYPVGRELVGDGITPRFLHADGQRLERLWRRGPKACLGKGISSGKPRNGGRCQLSKDFPIHSSTISAPLRFK